MFGSMQRGVNAYATVGLETSVISGSLHKLIVMLCDGALVAVKSAMKHMAAGHIAEKGAAMSDMRDASNQISDKPVVPGALSSRHPGVASE